MRILKNLFLKILYLLFIMICFCIFIVTLSLSSTIISFGFYGNIKLFVAVFILVCIILIFTNRSKLREKKSFITKEQAKDNSMEVTKAEIEKLRAFCIQNYKFVKLKLKDHKR